MKCKTCGQILKTQWTVERFKKEFKVGDVLIAFSTKKRLRISAIGEKRFLCIDEDGKERVLSMLTYDWRRE